ncbi:PAS domain-containing protein [Hymenobacter koreensis]|uniref:histidine kinase n=1 Tax=Hymenobacter koreensis TaxID=1084523 RepID=A0ABP8IXQ1_9BACT
MPVTIEELQRALAQSWQRNEELATALGHATAAAEAATRRLSQFTDRLPEGMLVINPDGTVNAVNQLYFNLYGLHSENAQMWLGRAGSDLMRLFSEQAADPALFLARAAEHIQPGADPVYEELIPLRDGRMLARNVIAMRPEDGQSGTLLLCVRDVTERVALEKQLRWIATIPAQNPNPILRISLTGEVLFANPSAAALREAYDTAPADELRTSLLRSVQQAIENGAVLRQELAWQRQLFLLTVAPYAADGYANLYLTDITAVRHAEQERDAQRSFYEHVLDALPVEVVVLDEQQRYVYANPQAVPDADARQWLTGRTLPEYCETFGYDMALAEHRHKMFVRANAGERINAWEDATSTGTDTKHHLRCFTPLANPTGFRFMLGYGLDITERRLAERRLDEQREFYETILNQLPGDVAVFDPEHRYQFVNPAAVRNPVMREWLIGKTDFDYCAFRGRPDDEARGRRNRFRQAVAEARGVTWEETTRDAAGRVGYVLRHLQPVFDGNGTLLMVIGYGADITQRRLDEEKLRVSEARLREQQQFTDLILDTTPSLIYVRDAQANYVFENRAMRELQAQSRHGQANELPANSPEAQEASNYAQTDAQILAGEPEVSLENSMSLFTGEVRWFHTIKRPLRRHDGTLHVLGVSTDITETRRAREAAEAALKTRENFLANMSHEIRTPMNGVLGMANLLAKTSLNSEQRHRLEVIQHSGQHLLAVLNDVLDLAKINSGKMELEQVSFNLSESTERVVQSQMEQARQKGLQMVFEPLNATCENCQVLGDPHRINQVLLNLVSNAIKFTASGTVTIASRQLAQTADDLTVEFRVTDTGMGIPADKQEHVFNDFVQAYADTTRQFGGTGLGLSICRALVEQMGGSLTLESVLGQGSTFRFQLTLPKAARTEPAAFENAPDYNTNELQGVRVLLVEDNEINRDVARQLLEEWGVAVDEAVDGESGVARFAERPYDLVLMDIQMPGMSGLEATLHLRRYPDAARAATPILALTANAFRADSERYLAAGMDACLAKPFVENELYQVMVGLLRKPGLAYDLAPLRELSRGREVFVHKIVRSFLANIPGSLAEIEAAAALPDWTEVAQLVHHIKPNLLAVHVQGVEPPLAQLERLRQGPVTPADAPVLHTAVARLLTAVRAALVQLPAELPPAAEPAV